MSIRVLYCMSCCRFHRELPDFLAPFKHFSLGMVANIYDGIVKKPAVDGSTIIRLRYWVDWVLKYGAAILKRTETGTSDTREKYNADSTLDTLRYFVMLVVNAGEWRSTSLRILSG